MYDQLEPTDEQLAQSASQQENVGEDVSQAGEDVARAGRHERRLGKPFTSDELTEAALDIEDVAQEEVAGSERRLESAAETAPPEAQPAGDNGPVLDAHASIDEAKEAISEQAEALGNILNPPSAESGQSPSEPELGQPSQAPPSSGQPSRPDPAQQAEGQMKARTLDELDQAMSGEPGPPQPGGEPQPGPPSLAQAASAEAAGMKQARMQSRMSQRNRPSLATALESAQGAGLSDTGLPEFTVLPVNRIDNEDWGQLRAKSAEDLTEGRREAISAEYRRQVETYFRVVAERARKKK